MKNERDEPDSQPRAELPDGRYAVDERLRTECFLCGKPLEIGAPRTLRCRNSWCFALYCHVACANRYDGAGLEFKYLQAVQRIGTATQGEWGRA